MFLGTLASSLLGNALAGKPQIPGQGVIRASKKSIKADQGF